jgi:hypothetical protein
MNRIFYHDYKLLHVVGCFVVINCVLLHIDILTVSILLLLSSEIAENPNQ